MPSAVQNSGLIGLGSPRTVVVTPENAPIYGFDKIGATINLDTGGIVDPFTGPADGFNRDARNTAVQQRALSNPNPVFPGYTEIMSNPANRAFNERLLGDPQFAWQNLQSGFDRQVDGNNPFYTGSPTTSTNTQTRNNPTTFTNPTSGGVNPFSNTHGTTTQTTGGQESSTGTAPKSEPGGSFGITPAPMGNTFSTTSAFQPVQTSSSSEYAPGRQNVTNAMMRRFNTNSWF